MRRAPGPGTAIVCGAEAITYGELRARIREIAAGVHRGERIALDLANSVNMLGAFLGVVHGGAIAMVMDPAWPPALRHNVLARQEPYRMLDQVVPNSSQDPPEPDDVFLMGFTSGTTGTPKAFIRTHRSWVATFAAAAAEFGKLAAGAVLAPGPLCHGLTLYAAVETLNAGGTIILQPRFDAADCAAALAGGRAQAFVCVPAMLDLVLDAVAEPLAPPLAIISAGAKLLPALRGRLQGLCPQTRIWEYYGASELSFVTVAHPDENCPPASVGRAFRSVDISVRDDVGTAVAPGDVGTVWVRSAMISSGYVGGTDGAGFRRDPNDPAWATVGDRGWLDRNGFLYLVGREGEMLISGGLNVYPSEVEDVLRTVPGVTEAAVIGMPDPRWGDVLVAVVAGTASRQALQAECGRQLPAGKVPRRWYRCDTWPLTSSGKVKRAELRAALPTFEELT